ncbi:MAG: hypothetical protein ACRDN0_21935 [Trebonia sp.]
MTQRAITLGGSGHYLRTTNNRNGRPFEEATVEVLIPVISLQGIGRHGASPDHCPGAAIAGS